MHGDCVHITELLIDYLHQGLPPRQRRDVLLHLAQCADCRLEMAATIRLEQVMVSLLEPLPEAVRKNAFAKVRAAAQEQHESLLELPLRLIRETLAPALRPAARLITTTLHALQ